MSCLVLVLLLVPVSANAITRIFVHNNTTFSLPVSIQLTGEPLASEHWGQSATVVKPGQRAEVLWFNRDTGITSGKNFRFASHLKLDGHQVDLVQELHGKTINSHLWQTLCIDGKCDQWYDNNDDHEMQVATKEEPTRVLYRSFFTGTDDNVEYIITQRPIIKPSGPTGINILAYNVYLRSIMINGQSIRTGFLKNELNRPWDVIVLSEAFDDDLRDDLVTALSSSFPYHSSVVGKESFATEDGGVIVISRWPIEYEDQRAFGDSCNGMDCRADKGVLYTRIVKQGKKYHLFASHTNADNSGDDISARRSQLQLIKNWINSLNIDPTEPVLIAGDLNVDKGQTWQYNEMNKILESDAPHYSGMKFSFDPSINDLASSNPPELLDYVLYSKKHLQPVKADSRVLLIRHSSGWKELATEKTRYDLSDHFAVLGEYEFSMKMGLLNPPVGLKAKIPLPGVSATQQKSSADVQKTPCHEYATVAVDQEKMNRKNDCGYVGPEWNANYSWHFDWCSKGNNIRFAAAARQKRDQQLQLCPATVKISEKSQKEQCRQYADSAIAQVQEAKMRNLSGIAPPVWSDNYSEHYNWCLAVPKIERLKGQELRQSILDRSKGFSPDVKSTAGAKVQPADSSSVFSPSPEVIESCHLMTAQGNTLTFRMKYKIGTNRTQPIFAGAWLYDVDQQIINAGYKPVAISSFPEGSVNIEMMLSNDATRPVYIETFLMESGKPAFIKNRFKIEN